MPRNIHIAYSSFRKMYNVFCIGRLDWNGTSNRKCRPVEQTHKTYPQISIKSQRTQLNWIVEIQLDLGTIPAS